MAYTSIALFSCTATVPKLKNNVLLNTGGSKVQTTNLQIHGQRMYQLSGPFSSGPRKSVCCLTSPTAGSVSLDLCSYLQGPLQSATEYALAATQLISLRPLQRIKLAFVYFFVTTTDRAVHSEDIICLFECLEINWLSKLLSWVTVSPDSSPFIVFFLSLFICHLSHFWVHHLAIRGAVRLRSRCSFVSLKLTDSTILIKAIPDSENHHFKILVRVTKWRQCPLQRAWLTLLMFVTGLAS